MKARRARPRGSALLTVVLVLLATLIVGMSALLKWSMAGYRQALNRSRRTKMLYTAESGCQYAMAALQVYAKAYETHPTTSDYVRIIEEFIHVASNQLPPEFRLVKYEFTEGAVYGTNSLADSLYRGARASVKPIYVSVGVEHIADTTIYAEVTQMIEARSFSIFEYGVFVDGDLMINSDKKMEIDGSVHANGVLSIGTRGAQLGLHLKKAVTSASNIYAISSPEKTGINYTDTQYKFMTDLLGQKLDSDHPYWTQLALLQWRGRVMSWVHGMPRLTLPIPNAENDPRVLIEPPHPDDTDAIAQARYANRAAVRIMPDGDVQVYSEASAGFTTVARVGDSAVSSWIDTNKYFWNNALNAFVRPLDIHVGNFRTWALANARDAFFSNSLRAGILYVAISNSPSFNVRLTNGSSLPNAVINGVSNGFTLATDNPVYVLGNYNDTTKCPASIISDAITVLSSDWKDSEHLSTNSPCGSAKNTSYLTSMLTGQTTNMNTFTAETWYGGIEDLPKYIENWSGTGASGNKEIRGTIAALWASKWERNNLVVPEAGPNRLWWYDPKFGYPPGAPRFHEFVPKEWRRSAKR